MGIDIETIETGQHILKMCCSITLIYAPLYKHFCMSQMVTNSCSGRVDNTIFFSLMDQTRVFVSARCAVFSCLAHVFVASYVFVLDHAYAF